MSKGVTTLITTPYLICNFGLVAMEETASKTYVYQITNKLNGKVYVGISIDPNKRFRSHCYSATNPNTALTAAIKKYGSETFLMEIVAGPLTRDEAGAEEIRQISELRSNDRKFGYNETPGGENPPSAKGIKRSAVTKQRIAEAHRGKVLTEDHRRKLGASRMGYKNRKGTTTSPEARIRLSESHRGFKIGDETKKVISKAMHKHWQDPDFSRTMRGKIIAGKRAKAALKPTIEERIITTLKDEPAPISTIRLRVRARVDRFYSAMNSLLSQGKISRERIGTFIYLHLV